MVDTIPPGQQAALANEAAGGSGGSLFAEGKPTPGSTRWRLEGGYLIQDVANADGIWSVNTNVPPVKWTGEPPGEKAPSHFTTPQGEAMWVPEANAWRIIGGTEPKAAPSTYHEYGGVLYEFPGDGSPPKPAIVDQAAIAERQAKAEADARAEAERNRQFNLNYGLSQNQDTRAALQLIRQLENDRLAAETSAATLEETQRNNRFNQQYKAFVDLPYQQVQDERAAQTARLGAAAQAGTYAAQRASEGRQAGQDAVSTILQTLPYRVRPEWNQQFLAAHNAEMAGQPIPAYTEAALGFQAPDLEGARQAASAQAQAALPSYDQLVAGAPQFPGMDPAQMARYQRMLLGLPYEPL